MDKRRLIIFLIMQIVFINLGVGLYFVLKDVRVEQKEKARIEREKSEHMTLAEAELDEVFGVQDIDRGTPESDAIKCDFPEWVGKPADEEAIKEIGRPYRILPPGSMVTMDFNPERLNIDLNDDNIVIGVRCG